MRIEALQLQFHGTISRFDQSVWHSDETMLNRAAFAPLQLIGVASASSLLSSRSHIEIPLSSLNGSQSSCHALHRYVRTQLNKKCYTSASMSGHVLSGSVICILCSPLSKTTIFKPMIASLSCPRSAGTQSWLPRRQTTSTPLCRIPGRRPSSAHTALPLPAASAKR